VEKKNFIVIDRKFFSIKLLNKLKNKGWLEKIKGRK
jgi:hypothetical protein